jgi:hypothetical protein
MEDIEEDDVAAEIGQGRVDILKAQFDVAITIGGNRSAPLDFARVKVQAQDRLKARAFPQIKGKQSHSAADVEDRLRGTA